MKYLFLRSAKYSEISQNDSLYQSFEKVAQNRIDPPILPGQQPPAFAQASTVFCTPARRAFQTAQLLSLKIKTVKDLREIEFSMKELLTELEFEHLPPNQRVNNLRKIFFEKLVSDQLAETYADVIKRLVRLANELLRQNGAVVCIGHSFSLKVLEVAAEHPEVIGHPMQFLKFYDGSHKAYEHMEGFSLTSEQLSCFVEHATGSKRKSNLK